jgi:outer membrane protein OmpA-like peptidoglycan-associated protein
MKNIIISSVIIFTLLVSQHVPASAQINVLNKVKEKTKERVENQVDKGIDKSLDKTEKAIEKAVTESDEEEEKSESPKDKKSEKGKTNNESAQQSSSVTPLTSFTQYDFVPGDKILFYDDFSQDAVGDFPAQWTTNGSGEIRTINKYPGKWLYMNSRDNVYCFSNTINFPENFIMEFDVVPTPDDEGGDYCSFYFTLWNQVEEKELDDDLYPGGNGLHITVKTDGWEARGYNNVNQADISGDTELAPVKLNQSNHVIVWVQKKRLRIYHAGKKVLDQPSVVPVASKFNRLRFSLWSQSGLPYLSNLKITTAAPDMRSKLLTEGKIVSYGIYFDSGKDVVKPESYGSIKEIAAVLNENPSVKINVVGHTDSDGDDAMNLDLSKRRAANVKKALVNDFGIAADRISTDGKGESQPLAPNSSPEGKSKNRRVEFIKI